MVACGFVLESCEKQANRNMRPKPAAVVETQWTRAAAEHAESLTEAALKKDPQRGGMKYALPQLRVYDPEGQLVYLLDPTKGWKPATIGAEIDRAVALDRPIPGPSLNETLADLETHDGRPARLSIAERGTPLVFDYWATWCVPCRILEKALLQWQSTKPAGSVQIVKAEADLMKLARSRGEKVYKMVKGKDGKLVKVEM